MISFRCDYEDGACPEVMEALLRTNGETTPGYGEDAHSAAAAARIRQWADCPEAEVFFTLGGTPTNAMTIAHLLRPYEAAIAAETGHINTHETGAVEATGHKVVTVPSADGKVLPEDVRAACAAHTDHHMVRPALLYLSQPTELGTLYSLEELAALRRVCDEEGLLLYCDGARLASALAARGNDVQVSDLARLCDAFYIGGTKCGALFGEALVFPKPALAQERQEHRLHLFTDRLKNGNNCHRNCDARAGNTDNPLEQLSIPNRFGIVNERLYNRPGAREQQNCTRRRHQQAIQERCANGRHHPFIIFRGEIIPDQRQHALGHPRRYCERHHIHLFGDTDPRHRFIGIGNHQLIQRDIGHYAHQVHQAAGQAHQKHLTRDPQSQAILPGIERNIRRAAAPGNQYQKISCGDHIGKHRCGRRPCDLHPERENKYGIQNDVQHPAQRHAEAGLPGISLCAHQMCKLLIEHCWDCAERDGPENILAAKLVRLAVRSGRRQHKAAQQIQHSPVNEGDENGCPDAERRRFFRPVMIARPQAARDQARAPNAEQVRQPCEKNEHRHTQRYGRHLVGIPDLADEKRIRHIVDHRNKLADHRGDHEQDHRPAHRSPFK